jgi:PHD/YefM family antitoxin component YafN of YafNO toxin-antitoxin module
MYQVTVDYAKKNLDELCDRATQESEGVAIVRENQSYVLITQEEWESLMETTMLLKVPNLLQDVETARQEYLSGKTFSMEQVFE